MSKVRSVRSCLAALLLFLAAPMLFAAGHPPSDFFGNGTSDLLWRNNATGQVYLMPMGAGQVEPGAVIWTEPNMSWQIVGTGDFDGDGQADILWWNSSTGQVCLMLMNGSVVKSSSIIYTEPNTAWTIQAVADFNGDGKADILWRNGTTGQVYLMLWNGSTVLSGAVIWTEPDPAWQIVAAADFDGDGKADILWWNSATGQVYLMLMNGTSIKSSGMIYTEPNTAWKIVGTGDFNGDGKADILWRNATTGQVYLMPMNGATVLPGSIIWTEPNMAWQIMAIGDFNGDGKSDIAWRNSSTGQVYEMLMNGLSISLSGIIYTEPDTAWDLLGQAHLVIAGNMAAPVNLTYTLDKAVYTQGVGIPSNNPASGGGAVAAYSVNPALPAGLVLNTSTGVISGTPTAVAATATYTVTASNSAGKATAGLSITVNAAVVVITSGYIYAPKPPGLNPMDPGTEFASVGYTFGTNATLLQDGRVFLTYGTLFPTSSIIPGAQIFDPITETCMYVGTMIETRYNYTTTLLPNGQVLCAGGMINSTTNTATAELFDPLTKTFSATGSMLVPQEEHTATLLKNGKVLILGMGAYPSTNGNAELYDPLTNTFSPTGPMIEDRKEHCATLLNNGKVLVTGGICGDDGGGPGNHVEIYDPATGVFQSLGSMSTNRMNHTSTLLSDGRVLIAGGQIGIDGGTNSAEIFNPATSTFSAPLYMSTSRIQAVASLLQNGDVLITGGLNRGQGYQQLSAELFNPSTNYFSLTGSMTPDMIGGFYTYTSTLLNDGRVLVTNGGHADLYTPGPVTATPTVDEGYWVNGVWTMLPRTGFKDPISLATSGSDIYATDSNLASGCTHPGYWKNKIWNPCTLPQDHSTMGSTTSIVVANGSVYVGGSASNTPSDSDSVPVYWKNGIYVVLPLVPGTTKGEILSITADNEDSYAAGFCQDANYQYYPGYWKNGAWVDLPIISKGTTEATATMAKVISITVVHGNIYAAGFNCGNLGYWYNGSWTTIPFNGEVSNIYSMFVDNNGNIFAGGVSGYNSTGQEVPGYWFNGTLTPLTAPFGGEVHCLAVNNGNVYAGGYQSTAEGPTIPGYWLNGEWTPLPLPTDSIGGAGGMLTSIIAQ